MSEVILIADVSPMSSVIVSMIKSEGFFLSQACAADDALQQLGSGDCRLIICDMAAKAVGQDLLLHLMTGPYSNLPKILLCDSENQPPMSTGTGGGQCHVIARPFRPDILVEKVFELVDTAELLKAGTLVAEALKLRSTMVSVVGVSDGAVATRMMAERLAATNAWVCICGEKGTDKEAVAKVIHACSDRNNQPFTSLSCAGQDPEALSHFLFGCEEMMLTGLLEATQGGTFFLGEIEQLPLEQQERLERFLQPRPAGSPDAPRTADGPSLDVRLLVGVPRPPAALVTQNLMIPSLATSLARVLIQLKPLRECREDILPLVDHALQRACGTGHTIPALDAELAKIFHHYHWPGNALEVDMVIKAMLAKHQGGALTPKHLPPHIAAIAKMRMQG